MNIDDTLSKQLAALAGAMRAAGVRRIKLVVPDGPVVEMDLAEEHTAGSAPVQADEPKLSERDRVWRAAFPET